MYMLPTEVRASNLVSLSVSFISHGLLTSFDPGNTKLCKAWEPQQQTAQAHRPHEGCMSLVVHRACAQGERERAHAREGEREREGGGEKRRERRQNERARERALERRESAHTREREIEIQRQREREKQISESESESEKQRGRVALLS